jgi:hypothetical protein
LVGPVTDLSWAKITDLAGSTYGVVVRLPSWVSDGSLRCPGWSGPGAVHRIGARRTATYTGNAVAAGTRVALMMAEGPGRGSFAVHQDGLLKGTISTRTSANANRVLTWTSGALSAGRHTFKIVNLASAGHPRIDVNAALATCPGALAGGEC